jgi:DNA-binding response OmpR family regulator
MGRRPQESSFDPTEDLGSSGARLVARASVLIVDDDEAFRATLRVSLRAHGYETHEVDSGLAAVEVLAAAADHAGPMPDAIVLDIMMPGLSGLGILQLMRRLGTRLPPTLLVTGFQDRSVDVVARKLGAVRVLRKPVSGDEVCAALLAAVLRARSSETSDTD